MERKSQQGQTIKSQEEFGEEGVPENKRLCKPWKIKGVAKTKGGTKKRSQWEGSGSQRVTIGKATEGEGRKPEWGKVVDKKAL